MAHGCILRPLAIRSEQPGEVVEPADDIDVVVVYRFLTQCVVLKVQRRQLIVDEQVLRQVLELTVRQVRHSRQLVRRLRPDRHS